MNSSTSSRIGIAWLAVGIVVVVTLTIFLGPFLKTVIVFAANPQTSVEAPVASPRLSPESGKPSSSDEEVEAQKQGTNDGVLEIKLTPSFDPK